MRKIPSYIKDILERITKYNGKLIKLNVALNKYFDSKRINFDAFDDFGCALANIQDGEVEEFLIALENKLNWLLREHFKNAFEGVREQINSMIESLKERK